METIITQGYVFGSEAGNSYYSGLDHNPSVGECLKFPVQKVGFSDAFYCPVAWIESADSVEHNSGINYRWTEKRFFVKKLPEVQLSNLWLKYGPN